jgi:hypothetical protein
VSLEADLVARLAGDAAIAALLGDRIGWGESGKEDELPRLLILQISAGRDYSHQGATAQAEPRLSFDMRGSSTGEVRRIRAALIARLETQEGTGATSFGPAFLVSSVDMPVETLSGGVRVYRAVDDFTVWHQPA